MKIVTAAIREDDSYRVAWQANIAVAFQDCFRKYEGRADADLHTVSNEAATNFLNLLTREVDND